MDQFQEQIARIQAKFPLARQADPTLGVFGAESHEYIVHPPASAEAVLGFEQRNAVVLPNAYKAFLLGVGNGGVGFGKSAAGPFYGIYPLGQGLDDIPADAPHAALVKPCVVSPGMSQQDWTGLTSRLGLEETQLPDEEHEAAICTLFGGLLPIGSQGCSFTHCLVLNGPWTGRVVNVTQEYNAPPVFAHEPDFLAWYERWLDEVISGDLLQSTSWFGYVKGGTEVQLLAGLQASNDAREEQDNLDGLLSKRRLTQPTLLELIQRYADRAEHQATVCRIVCKSDAALARPLLATLAPRDPLTFFQCLHWYARDRIPEWEQLILSCAGHMDNEETFRFFTYVLEQLGVDQGMHLIPYTRSPQAGIRTQAFYALGKLQDKKRFLACFIEGLHDTETAVVRTALQSLSGVPDPSLLPHYQQVSERFPVEQDYVLSNLNRRLEELGTSRANLGGAQ
jgi:hypothetical protein